ncbi:MAG: acetate--CoA ligase [Acidobacteria bacterium RIFCSPLOWO2_12_FULL_54_10]|nr:MAG: acetate--CoA ligase [Acidobacteria bacterium RIFCSPLOWO2_12_FULL_54_10]
MADPKQAAKAGAENEAHIAVHWREEEYVYPPAKFIGQANLTDPAVLERFSEKNFPECYREYADMLDWDEYWHTTLDTSNPQFWKWFVGGKLNVSYNCVDRHLKKYKNKAALIFVPEPEDEPVYALTYQELYTRVNEVAAVLREDCGLKTGDRVTIHMPMILELPITMLACARLGVVHSVVFGGFSGEAAGLRAADSGSHVMVYADGYYRGGKKIDHKASADIAVEMAKKEGQKVDKILVWRRHRGQYMSAKPMIEGRDYFMDDLLKKHLRKKVAPVSLDSEAPLFLMYTSGTTGKPKGCQHRTGGYLAYVTGTSKYYQDIHPEDVYWCMADIGWITGHSYIVYGPLALGGTSVIFEGVPNYPDSGRVWRIAEQLDVNIFHTSPTAIRMLRKTGPDEPQKYNYHFKHMTTVGEPIEPETWRWYYESVGKGEAVIVDTWWQTETGGFLCTTKPGMDPMKAGSAGPPALGIYPAIYDEENKDLKAGSGKAGNICIRNPWPGIMQTIWGDNDRFTRQYYTKYCKNPKSTDWRDWPYFAADGAVLPADGYFRILGRVDDVINVAGHRLGTKELEAACLTVKEVAEAAVVPVVDEIKGRMPVVYMALKPGVSDPQRVEKEVISVIETLIGKIARPKSIHVVSDLPKTRSGKIMRRVLAAISNTMDVGDVTTLANPDIVEEIRKQVQGTGPVQLKEGPEDVKLFGSNE